MAVNEPTPLAPVPFVRPGAVLLAPPMECYVTGEDNLQVRSIASVANVQVTVAGRLLQPNGAIQDFGYIHITSGTLYETTQQTLPLGEGFLLNLTVATPGTAIEYGRCFVRVALVRGLTGVTVGIGNLVQGYVTSRQGRAWPGSQVQSSFDGPGAVRLVIVPDPPAGVESIIIVPVGARWQLLSYRIILVTSAAAGTRNLALSFTRDVDSYLVVYAAVGQAPSATQGYNFATGMPDATAAVLNNVKTALPTDIVLFGGDEVRTNTVNMDGADDYAVARLIVREHLEAD